VNFLKIENGDCHHFMDFCEHTKNRPEVENSKFSTNRFFPGTGAWSAAKNAFLNF